MKKTICALSALFAMGGAAMAADIAAPAYYAPAPRMLPGAFSWAGWYVGANLGYQWGSVTKSAIDPSGVAGGVQGGYNFQNGAFVYGAETDLQISGADATVAPFEFSNPWWGTFRGRAGYAWNNFLFYATAGLAYGDVKAQTGGLTESKTHLGWAAGAGVEMALNQAWSAKAEYIYVDLDNRLYTTTGVQNGFWSNMLRFGVNYHF
jgi:outer membrane immunogenic protein